MIVPAEIQDSTKQPDLSEIPENHRDKVSTKYLPRKDKYEVTLPPEVEIEQIKSRLNEVKIPNGGPFKKLEEAIAELDQRISALEE